MKQRFNPATGQIDMVEDDSPELTNMTGPEMYPDFVDAQAIRPDLSDPNRPFAGAVPISGRAVPAATDVAQTPRGQQLPMLPLSSPGAADAGGPSAGQQMLAGTPSDAYGQPPALDEAALPAPGSPAPAAPAPPPVKIGPVTDTTRTRESEKAKAGQADQEAAAKANIGIAGRQGAQNEAVAKSNAELVAQEAKDKETARVQEAADRQAAKAKLDAAYAERDRILNDAEKTSLKSYWSDKPAGAKLLADFSSALGAYAAIMSNGKNYAEESLQSAFARDDARKQQTLKQAIYRAGLQGERAKEAYENGLQEIALRKSSVLDKLADRRAAVLASKGVDQAKIETDAGVNAARMQAGKLREEFGHYADVKVHSSNELAQRFKMESALQDQRLAAAAAKPEAGRGITDARQRAQLVVGLKDQTKIVKALAAKGVKLTDEDLQKIQDNRTYLEAAKHGDKSTMDALGTNIMRSLGALPRNEFDGIDESKKPLAGALNLMTQKAALLNAGSMTAEGIAHARETVDLLAPGIGREERARRMQYTQEGLIGTNSGMVPGTVAQAQAGADALKGGREAQIRPTSSELATVMAARNKAGKGTPEYMKYDSIAKRMQSEMGR